MPCGGHRLSIADSPWRNTLPLAESCDRPSCLAFDSLWAVMSGELIKVGRTILALPNCQLSASRSRSKTDRLVVVSTLNRIHYRTDCRHRFSPRLLGS
jgi:hypothetical protein